MLFKTCVRNKEKEKAGTIILNLERYFFITTSITLKITFSPPKNQYFSIISRLHHVLNMYKLNVKLQVYCMIFQDFGWSLPLLPIYLLYRVIVCPDLAGKLENIVVTLRHYI